MQTPNHIQIPILRAQVYQCVHQLRKLRDLDTISARQKVSECKYIIQLNRRRICALLEESKPVIKTDPTIRKKGAAVTTSINI